MMKELNKFALRNCIILFSIIFHHCNIVKSYSICAIDIHKQFVEQESDWIDDRGLLKYYEPDIILPEKCQPCETTTFIRKAERGTESNICYKTNDDDSLADDNLCDWYPYEESEEATSGRKFPNIAGLKVLSLTKYKIETWFHIDETFDGLTDLEYLFLESNHITGWNISGTQPNLTNLKVLSLANNPIEVLSKDSFLWLNNSSIEYLNLRGCSGLKVLDTLVFTPLKGNNLWLDLSFTIIDSYQLANLTAGFQYHNKNPENKGLKVLSLAHTGLTKIPNEALTNVAHSLEKLSLQGNYFSNCWSADIKSEGVNAENCSLPIMTHLNEINLRDSGVTEFPCQILFQSVQNLEKLLLDKNPLSRMICSASSNISYLSLRSLTTDRYGFQLCSNESRCLFSNLTTLDMSHTKISAINFTDLTNLQILSLCNTGLENISSSLEPLENLKFLDLGLNNLTNSIDNTTFKSLTSLQELNLQSCSVESLSPLTFQNLGNLQVLDVSRNSIRILNETYFKNLKNLEKLLLKQNRIRPWKNSLFKSENNIKILNLQSNWLNDITNKMIQDFLHVEELDLSFNPLSCTCDVINFFQNYQSFPEDYLFNLVDWNKTESYICITKDNVQNPLNDKINNDSCQKVTDSNSTTSTTELETTTTTSSSSSSSSTTTTTVSTTEASPNTLPLDNQTSPETIDLTFVYIISALVASILIGSLVCYWKRWNIRTCAHIFKKSLVLTMLKENTNKTEKNKNYQYDVFLSYSDRDREWILEQLIPNIEQQSNIKVCLHERDFQAGLPVLENIMACMDHSRCVLLVLSEAFLRSHWCQFELNLAQHRLLEMQHDRLILVLLEDIPRDKCSKMLRYLMITKTYLLWPAKENEEGKRLFWRKLKKAIGPIHDTVNVSFV